MDSFFCDIVCSRELLCKRFLSNEAAPFLSSDQRQEVSGFFFFFLVHASGVSRLLSFFSCKSGIYESKENPGNPPPRH